MFLKTSGQQIYTLFPTWSKYLKQEQEGIWFEQFTSSFFFKSVILFFIIKNWVINKGRVGYNQSLIISKFFM